MGQSLKKFGIHQKEDKEIGLIIEQCYDKYFQNTEDWSIADFYHAVCQTVVEINRKNCSTQFHVPTTGKLKQAYKVSAFGLELLSYLKPNHQGIEKSLTMGEFQRMLQVVILEAKLPTLREGDADVRVRTARSCLVRKAMVGSKVNFNGVFIPAAFCRCFPSSKA